MGAVAQEQIAVTKYVVPLVFQATDVPDAAGSAGTVQADSSDYVMPFAGSIIGISVRHNAALTGGTLTWRPTLDGTADTTMTVDTDSSSQQAYANQKGRQVSFDAGARLGVDWTKSGTVAPTTTDATITLFVLLEDIRM